MIYWTCRCGGRGPQGLFDACRIQHTCSYFSARILFRGRGSLHAVSLDRVTNAVCTIYVRVNALILCTYERDAPDVGCFQRHSAFGEDYVADVFERRLFVKCGGLNISHLDCDPLATRSLDTEEG